MTIQEYLKNLSKDHESHTNQEIRKLKAHAVEVLTKVLWGGDWDIARAEARALLGWDNENNDKEK